MDTRADGITRIGTSSHTRRYITLETIATLAHCLLIARFNVESHFNAIVLMSQVGLFCVSLFVYYMFSHEYRTRR
jgi:hypothetical protein